MQVHREVRPVAVYPYDVTAALDRRNVVAQQWIYRRQPYVFQFANALISTNLFDLEGKEDDERTKKNLR